ncbi:MAG: bifunctional glycosyltransferase family 2/GtrA family protein [Methanobacterium sp.]
MLRGDWIPDFTPESKVAFVIPVYNEANVIGDLLNNINEIIPKSPFHVDIFVFEDGSTDETKKILETLYQSGNIPRLKINMTPERKGYPKAAKEAIMSIDPSKYPYILFMDGDGQYVMEDIFRLLDYCKQNPNYDMIIGCRKHRVEPLWRKFITASLRFLESILFGPTIKDVTSALRLMNTELTREITSQVSYTQYNFWFEFTARMTKYNLKVMEVPVNYVQREDGDSQVYSLKKIPKILLKETNALLMTFYDLNRYNIIKFGLVGLSGAIIILFLTWFLTQFIGLWYILSAIISIELSIIWAFTLNTKITFNYTFKNSQHIYTSLLKYHGTALGGMLINLVILYLLTEYIHIYYLLSESIAIVVAFGFNYFASTRYVWKKSLDL